MQSLTAALAVSASYLVEKRLDNRNRMEQNSGGGGRSSDSGNKKIHPRGRQLLTYRHSENLTMSANHDHSMRQVMIRADPVDVDIRKNQYACLSPCGRLDINQGYSTGGILQERNHSEIPNGVPPNGDNISQLVCKNSTLYDSHQCVLSV